MTDEHELRRAAALIGQADALLVAAGAGMGVDSGLPDFRGTEGFWRAYPALGRRGLGFTLIANPAAFDDDPRTAWGFYGHRLALYRRTRPHAGFGLLRAWGEARPQGVAVFTSNVDGQFQGAGFAAPLVECHGSIHHLQCSRPCHDGIWPADGFVPEVDDAACRLLGELPRCPRCGAVARPNILMFGDGAWIERRAAQQQRELEGWRCRAGRLVIVEVGAGTAVATVRAFGHALLREHQAVLLRLNPREPQVPRPQDVGLAMPALAALEAIDRLLAAG